MDPEGLTTRASGRAPSVINASDHIAPIHPSAWINACEIGANTNCPTDPPALMMPAALPRLSSARWCAAAPISTEKLPAPAPIAASTPSATIRPKPEVMKGVRAVPIASTTNPATNTFPGPYRSATAPATGWIAPHMNCPTASAKLMVVMPRPVDVLSGETNRPSDWRAPIVTIRMAAADSVTTTAGLLQVLIDTLSERLLEWPQIDFVGPGAARLPVNLPVRLRDG